MTTSRRALEGDDESDENTADSNRSRPRGVPGALN